MSTSELRLADPVDPCIVPTTVIQYYTCDTVQLQGEEAWETLCTVKSASRWQHRTKPGQTVQSGTVGNSRLLEDRSVVEGAADGRHHEGVTLDVLRK